jgi:pSer/pThr/pTyr-binding forkhead associated (FHA) protein
MRVKLLVVQGRPEGKSLLFPVGEYVFGRGAECHIRPNSDWVSRQHCMLRVTPDGVFVRDLGSRNGTLVNGTRVLGECRLGAGDQLQVGPLVFELQLEAPAPRPAASRLTVLEDTAAPGRDTAEIPNAAGNEPQAPAPEPDRVSATRPTLPSAP